MFTVATAASSTDLTTLDAVKAELNITTTTDDDYLTSLISRMPDLVYDEINVATADDGSRTIGRESLIETFRPDEPWCSRLRSSRQMLPLVLARWYVPSITTVVVGDTTLDATEYEVDQSGRLFKLDSSGNRCRWSISSVIVVSYDAGWALPGDSNRNLPTNIEAACFETIKAVRFSRSRDPLLRSENILEGLYSYSLFGPSADGSAVLPPAACSYLARYRVPVTV